MIELGTLPESHFLLKKTELPPESILGPPRVRATAINDLGQVAGDVIGYDTSMLRETRSFLTGPNEPINAVTVDLEPYDGSREYGNLGYDQRFRLVFHTPFWQSLADPSVNNRGQVTGQYFDLLREKPTDVHRIRAFRTAPGRPINPETDDLGFIPRAYNGLPFTIPRDINIHGQVVGISGENAFRTAPNRPINPATDDLGSGEAWGINDRGWAVLTSYGGDGQSHGFLYDGLRKYDLNDLIPPGSGWTISMARDINNHGQIIAWAAKSDRKERGVLLDPAPDYSPLYWLLAGTVLTGLGQAARRRREGD
jgi:hypothetical protein